MTATNLDLAHKQWNSRPADERFQNIEDLHAFVLRQRNLSRVHDIKLDGVDIKATEDGDLAVNGAMVKAFPTSWAFGQVARYAGAPAGYLRTLPADVAASALKASLRKRGQEGTEAVRWMIRDTDEDGTRTELVAATSPSYGRIFNEEVVAAAKGLLSRFEGRFFNPPARNPITGITEPSGLYASDRDCFLFYVDGGSVNFPSFDDGKSAINRGWIISNSEVGSASLSLTSFLFREVCCNHIIWGAEDIKELRIRHTSGAPARFEDEVVRGLEAFANSTHDKDAAAIKAAQAHLLPSKPEDQLAFFKKLGFNGSEYKNAKAYAEQEEGQFATLYDAINGLTASARDLAYADARVDLSRRAGKLFSVAA